MEEKLPQDNRVVELNMEDYQEEPNADKKKIILIIIAVLFLMILGLVLYFNSNRLFRAQENGVFQEPPTISRRVQDDDMDNDGIADTEEASLGLSSQDFDTDNDGIPDKMERDKFKTDPTKADTDGDGFADGFEIISGFNPLGEGKL